MLSNVTCYAWKGFNLADSGTVGGIVNWKLKPSWIHVGTRLFVECRNHGARSNRDGLEKPTLWTIASGRMALAMSSWWMPCECELSGRALLAKPTDEYFQCLQWLRRLVPNLLLLLLSSGCGGLPRVGKCNDWCSTRVPGRIIIFLLSLTLVWIYAEYPGRVYFK